MRVTFPLGIEVIHVRAGKVLKPETIVAVSHATIFFATEQSVNPRMLWRGAKIFNDDATILFVRINKSTLSSLFLAPNFNCHFNLLFFFFFSPDRAKRADEIDTRVRIPV